MSSKKTKSILKFRYSYPYEGVLLALVGKKLTRQHSKACLEKVKIVQRIWDKYDRQVVKLFKEMYKIGVPEKVIKVYISLVLPNSYSDPMTISLKKYVDIDKNLKQERAFVYVVIHELAHYFAYTRKGGFFNRLYDKIQEIDLFGEHGVNLHYLIHAAELGIVGEIFGPDYAKYSMNWKIEKGRGNEYGKSALHLRNHGVPLDKSCLNYINEKTLKVNNS